MRKDSSIRLISYIPQMAHLALISLFDNLVKKKEDRFLCDFHYVIIDEADSVLLDSAIMPLVISGVPRVQSNLYDVCDFFSSRHLWRI